MVASALLLRPPPSPRGAAHADQGGGRLDGAPLGGGRPCVGEGDHDLSLAVGDRATTATAAAGSASVWPSRLHPLAATLPPRALLPGGAAASPPPPGPSPIYRNHPAMAAVGRPLHLRGDARVQRRPAVRVGDGRRGGAVWNPSRGGSRRC